MHKAVLSAQAGVSVVTGAVPGGTAGSRRDQWQSYVESVPAPGLAVCVRSVWIQRTGPRPCLQRDLPTGGVELQCPIGEVPQLLGPLTVANVQILPPHMTVVGARYCPRI
jgi:hypothetical protein